MFYFHVHAQIACRQQQWQVNGEDEEAKLEGAYRS